MSSEGIVEPLRLQVAALQAPRAWSSSLQSLARRCELGESMQQVVESTTWKAPHSLRCLCRQALLTPRPAETVLQVVSSESKLRENWRDLWISLVYPGILLIASLVLLKLLSVFVINKETFQFALIDYRDAKPMLDHLSDFQHIVDGCSFIVLWSAIMGLTVYLVGTPLLRWRVTGALPIVGRSFRWLNLSRALARVAVLYEQGGRLDEAIKQAADSFDGTALKPILAVVSDRLTETGYLGYGLHRSLLSDERAGAILVAMDADDAPWSQRLVAASQVFQLLTRQLNQRYQILLPILMMILIGSLIANALSIYFAAVLHLQMVTMLM